ncbi:MAG: dihydrodipicolinate synthase family protein [Verrucomicrobia bacterium]|nr:dihydrodipicolinate synthase family protein [Verrucomicrobiota bacterium]
MKPLCSDGISGTWGAVLLPLNADDSIDFVALAEQVQTMLDAGLAGVYTNGTAGELHEQEEAEFDRLSTLVAEACTRRSVPFQIGVGHMSARVARERLRRVVALAPGAVQVILPDWVPIAPAEAEHFLLTMAELAAPVALVLYTPGHAKRPLDLAAIARLRAAVPGLVGVKTPDGNASWYASMRRLLPGFSVFVPGHHLATGLRSGASGSYSNIACLSPRGAQRWFERCVKDPAAGLAFEQRLLAFFQEQVAPLAAHGLCSAALDKALAAAGGWAPIPPRLRWPYQSADAAAVARLGRAARAALPELWE